MNYLSTFDILVMVNLIKRVMTKQTILYLGIGIFFTVILVGVILKLVGVSTQMPATSSVLGEEEVDINSNILNESEDITMSTVEDFEELVIETIQQGQGPQAVNGNILVLNYEGTLSDGTKFDSSYDRGTPFEFQLGSGMVIQGWEEGVLGMQVGEIRQLSIPSSKGYGSSGAGTSIPPYAGLIFKVELLEIK